MISGGDRVVRRVEHVLREIQQRVSRNHDRTAPPPLRIGNQTRQPMDFSHLSKKERQHFVVSI